MMKADVGLLTKPVEVVLETMESFAVIKVALGTRRAELMKYSQGHDEAFRTFAARVRGKAETCDFVTLSKCSSPTCNTISNTSYTEETIKDVMLAGISDNDIRRETLSTENILSKSVNEIISFVEGKEMGRNAIDESASVSAISAFQRNKKGRDGTTSTTTDKSKQIACPSCSTIFNVFRKGKNGWNIRPFKICFDCYRNKAKPSNSVQTLEVSNEEALLQQDHQVSQICSHDKILLDKEIFSKNGLRKAKVADHPRAKFNLSMKGVDRSVCISGVADTGAQSNLWGLEGFEKAGFRQSDLLKVNVTIRAANKHPVNILGAFNATFSGMSPDNEVVSGTGIVYVSDSVEGFFLSYDTMVDLLMLNRNFPTIGACKQAEPNSSVNAQSVETDCPQSTNESLECGCPKRTKVPLRPDSLPFKPEWRNRKRMREWLLKRYASSTFNICPHRPLQQMDGPPLEIHLDPDVKPRVCHTPSSIPIHWQRKVLEDILRDIALGILERVPYGVPVTWCHRMVVTRKHDGTPRRTVDLSPLNRFCKRETYASETPFHLARRIPKGTYKTVTDAWNGYHSVPLREADWHLTTFITPFGRFRYTRAPQGFLSSGDGYNRRFSAILAEFERKERCVDDTIHYDEDLETHWWRTIDFLTKVGEAGIILNPGKFQFSEKVVEFAGFRISSDNIEPLPRYLDAISSFPTPQNSTDVRSWFGLINQVSNYAQLRSVLSPFRQFLSPKCKFQWSDELNDCFIKSKDVVIEAIKQGVQIFDLEKPTCLRPDWSKQGIGYFLSQKHCECSGKLPGCCQSGWKITLAGSRFLSSAEERYAAVEGEALAVAWGLEQSKYFTQGCPNLIVVTDHKPLTKLFGDRTLDEIDNTRLFRLKQRTLPWQFEIEYMPGKTNLAADAASRYPSPYSTVSALEMHEEQESLLGAIINQEVQKTMSLNWEDLARETGKDPVLSKVVTHLVDGGTQDSFPSEYARYENALYVHEDVVMYKDRVVVPKQMRPIVLKNLHAAHQGVSAMEQRAQALMFWPGITYDIHMIRAKCDTCNRNAPSQAELLSEPAQPPSTPFEKVFADYFVFAGHYYLVVGDRLSGWSEVFNTPAGTANSGAKGLISCLRKFFSTFGVPEEISSDGGPEFASGSTAEFFQAWNIQHRVSSAYHPRSNGRAEVAVKSAKRLLRSNIDASGQLDNDKLLGAMLQLRNTPDPDCKISPAEIVFGHPLRDRFAFANRLEKFSNPSVRSTWREAWKLKEDALRVRFVKTSEKLNQNARNLKDLRVGDRCMVQNQYGNYPLKWDRSGTVVEVLPFNQYRVMIDGSRRVTRRNRKYLRLYTPATETIGNEGMPKQIIPAESPAISPACECDDKTTTPAEPAVVEPMQRAHEPPRDFDLAPTAETPPEPCDDQPSESGKEPLALKRLRGHNHPGLEEPVEPSMQRLRPRKTTSYKL